MGFGIHEALDQTGAVLGPLIIAFIFYFKGGYTESFAILAVPAILALSILFVAKRTYPGTPSIESIFEKPEYKEISKFSPVFWFYSLFVVISVLGYVNFQLVSYHFKTASIISDAQIPVFFGG